MSAQLFTEQDRDGVIRYWKDPARYATSPARGHETQGEWRVRQTTEGSKWLWSYQRKAKPGKINPAVDPKAENATQARWDAWIDKKYAWDEQEARKKAAANNSLPFTSGPIVGNPGSAPADLVRFAGQPPAFYAAVQPIVHTITFHDGTELEYETHTNVRRKYAYYRFDEGVMSIGERVRNLPASELNDLFSSAGISSSVQRVMKAVSLLEGGFDSLNTYDTGYVSVGFIQFASLSKGSGSLGQVMARMKSQWPDAFQENFRQMGLDVTSSGVLVAMDPTTGMEFTGAAANQRIIRDKRLAATFQRAGRVSKEFRLAQLLVAKEEYYPGDDKVTAKVNGRTQTAKVKDLFRTEAGMATLMDRKVNTGKLGSINAIVQDIVNRFKLRDIKQAARHEYEMTKRLQYRKNYLSDGALTRPSR